MSLLAFALAAALSGQEPTAPPDCLDDNLTDRCAAADRERVLAHFGAPTIEADAASGAEVYRALYVDGYGRDLPIIAFERRPGQSPQAVFYGSEGRRLAAPIQNALWRRVQRETRFADQAVRPQTPPGERDMSALCLHAWVTTIEMANAPLDRYAQTPVRRRTEDACGSGLTTQTAFLLSELAQEAFPQCSGLDRDFHRSMIHLLAVCASLEGDVLAASELQNTLDERSSRGTVEPMLYWSRYLGVNAVTTLDWNGEIIRAPLHGQQVAEFLAARRRQFWPDAIRAENAREAVVRGIVEQPQADDGPAQRADYVQQWAWNPAGRNWTLKSMTVGPFTTGGR